jgi:predicted DNA-binding transcriptional regulator AlpA
VPKYHYACRANGMQNKRASVTGDKYINGTELAKQLGIGRTTLTQWVKAGELPKPEKSISGMMLFSRKSLHGQTSNRAQRPSGVSWPPFADRPSRISLRRRGLGASPLRQPPLPVLEHAQVPERLEVSCRRGPQAAVGLLNVLVARPAASGLNGFPQAATRRPDRNRGVLSRDA